MSSYSSWLRWCCWASGFFGAEGSHARAAPGRASTCRFSTPSGASRGYPFIALGIYIALQLVGINFTSLAFVAGAVGVGIGFGLQNIVNNFVSGLIILAERPIAIGDRVEVGGVAGRITRMSLRSTTVVTNDNISIIVPNANFITHPVTNWSHGDPRVQIRLAVGVAYGSDLESCNAPCWKRRVSIRT